MSADSVSVVYISCACNRTPHCLDWGRNGLLCYGAANAVAVYDPEFSGAGKVTRTLSHHTSRINCVRWIKHLDGAPETECVSASSDRTAVVWSKQEDSFKPVATLKGHENIVTYVEAIYLARESSLGGPNPMVLFTASVDSTAKIWERQENQNEFKCSQTLSFGTGFCLVGKLCILPDTDVMLLACATDDSKIHLFGKNLKRLDAKFDKVDSLSGHEDWVRAMDFAICEKGDVLLASGAQDGSVRLWRISTQADCKPQTTLDDIRLKERLFHVLGTQNSYTVTLESVLSGHEGWVYGVSWAPAVWGEDRQQPLKLLTVSMDHSLLLWEADPTSGVWLESARLGAVGGNTLGFYGAQWGPCGAKIVAHGYQGSLHRWGLRNGEWCPEVAAGGHFAEVTDLGWDPRGQHLLSLSADQTTRLHAPWVRGNSTEVTWHELARPQVHGYDLSCIAVLDTLCFASGAEEKVVRAFTAPKNFVTNFHRVSGVNIDAEWKGNVPTPEGASVPALGLSNKAVYEGEDTPNEGRHVKDQYPEAYFVPVELDSPPTEEDLLQNTLWPEVQKLYGHGYELFALAARRDGRLLASACKASSAQHASILLWDTETWQQRQTLPAHLLTITQLAFSPDGGHLLSVSRDRCWALFKCAADGLTYQLITTLDKKAGIHARIIWTCSWTPNSAHFLTGSRDGRVAAWSRKGILCGNPLELRHPVTAVAVAPVPCQLGSQLVAVGLESGCVRLYFWDAGGDWQLCRELDNSCAHHLAVKRLAFRPVTTGSTQPRTVHLASCGADNAVKIFAISLDSLSFQPSSTTDT